MKAHWVVNSLTVLIAGSAIWLEFSAKMEGRAAHSDVDATSVREGRLSESSEDRDKRGMRGKSNHKDFLARAAHIEGLVGVRRALAIRELAKDWANYDSSAALRWANTLPKGYQRADAICEILKKAEDAVALSHVIEEEKINLSEIGQFSDTYSWNFSIALAREIGNVEALDWFRQNMKGGGMDLVYEAIVWDVASRDPDAALQLAETALEVWVRDKAAKSIFETGEISGSDQMNLLFELVDRDFSYHFFSAQLQSWEFEDIFGGNRTSDVIRRIKVNRHLPEMDKLAAAAVSVLDRQQSLEAFELLGESGKNRYPDVYAGIYEKWMTYNGRLPNLNDDGESSIVDDEEGSPIEIPDELITYATENGELPEVGNIILKVVGGSQKYELANSLVEKWLSQSPEGCQEWVASLSPGKIRDAATMRIVQHLAAEGGIEAEVWIEQIDDPALHQQAMDLINQKR